MVGNEKVENEYIGLEIGGWHECALKLYRLTFKVTLGCKLHHVIITVMQLKKASRTKLNQLNQLTHKYQYIIYVFISLYKSFICIY